MSYRVQLPVFSGPMDLLLHLVRQHEVDVHEVSMARILEDYLQHLEVLRELDLHDIGDFVVMASTLMEIKSRDLLPNEEIELEEEFDPRDDLIRRLLEYKRYRDLSRELEARADRRSRQSPLSIRMPRQLREQPDEDLLDIGEIQIWDLTQVFARLLDEIGQHTTMEIEVEKRSVGYYTERLLKQFKRQPDVDFTAVFDRSEGRYGLIGTLIAILEMMKQGYLRAVQADCFGDIQLSYQGSDDVSADQILAGITAEEAREAREAKAAELAAERSEEQPAEQSAGQSAGSDPTDSSFS